MLDVYAKELTVVVCLGEVVGVQGVVVLVH